MAENTQILVQRLVDGELNRQQIRELLRNAESDPSLYRNVALSMVEDQLWRREVVALAGDGDPGSSAGSAAGTASLGTGAASHSRDYSRAAEHSAAWPWRQGLTFLATAAAMLLMTWLGYQSGLTRGSSATTDSPVAGFPSAAPSQQQLADVAPGSGDQSTAGWDQFASHRIQFVSNDGNTLADRELSVIPYSTARELGVTYQTHPIPVDVQRRYNQQGVELRPEIQCIRGRLDDGRQVIVPVQYIRAQPWGQ